MNMCKIELFVIWVSYIVTEKQQCKKLKKKSESQMGFSGICEEKRRLFLLSSRRKQWTRERMKAGERKKWWWLVASGKFYELCFEINIRRQLFIYWILLIAQKLIGKL